MIDIEQLKAEFSEALAAATTSQELFQLQKTYTGKKGPIKKALGNLRSVPAENRRTVAQQLNALKQELESQLTIASEAMAAKELEAKLAAEWMDMSMPGVFPEQGGRHPVTEVERRCLEVLRQLGFEWVDGPEIEEDWYNFTALNFPENHPAREMQDTFFISKDPDIVLRTHTSNVQIRLMEKQKPPMRVIIPGRVYRNETVSAKSHCFFHQVEGLYIDKNVSFKDLKDTLYYFAKEMFGSDTKVRFRPSYFPFTEPSAEMDISWKNGWLEILGSGLVDPNVLKNCGIDPKEYSGFAFGMGIERIAMLKYGIDDLRLFSENDKRFLRQFRGVH